MSCKRLFATVLAMGMLMASLAGCTCLHDWQDGDCNNPKTCKICHETLGQRLGHDWKNANCMDPQVCDRCGAVGEQALGHSWVEATTEKPKTCRICGVTEGDPIVTDSRFHTADTAPFAGTWEGQFTIPVKDFGYNGVQSSVVYNVVLTFGKAGEFSSKVSIASGLSIKNEIIRLVEEDYYAVAAASGKDKEAADAEMKTNWFGWTVKQYATFLVQNYTFQDKTSNQMTGVYYVEDGQVHAATAWDEDMSETYGSITEGSLSWTDPITGHTVALTKKA